MTKLPCTTYNCKTMKQKVMSEKKKKKELMKKGEKSVTECSHFEEIYDGFFEELRKNGESSLHEIQQCY